MEYNRQYKKFIYGYNFAHGLQTTFCIVLPSLAGFYIGQLTYGVLISIGSICVSSIDTPGPPKHRRNSLVLGAACVLVSALAMSSYFISPLFGDLVLLSLIFSLSMVAVYGIRVTNIGLAGIYALILVTESRGNLNSYLTHAGLFFTGAIWYAFISLLTFSFRPYQLIQQALSDCIFKTADYLRLRAGFYQQELDFNKQFDQLITMQVEVSNSHEVVRRLLLQRWSTSHETTRRGRSLLLILIDTIDIHEQVMAAHIDTQELQHIFAGTGILEEYQALIRALAHDLDKIAIAVGAGKPAQPQMDFKTQLDSLQQRTRALRAGLLTKETLGAFINLRNVRSNIAQIAEKTARLHRYTRLSGEGELSKISLGSFIEQEDYSWQKLRSNLGPHSMFFRHAVRVSAAVAAGILISTLFPVQRSYWILFTIVVILKPGFSLSKSRNADRIIGTVAGGILTFLMILTIKVQLVLFILLVLCMIITYSFSSINYALSTFTTTCFVLLFFNFIKPGDFSFIRLRLIDTGIGSGLAILSSYFIFPVWEFQHIDDLLVKMTRANIAYLNSVAIAYTGSSYDENSYKLARKEVYISSANLASAFQRMMTEPKSKQQSQQQVHQFVVLSHELSAHIAGLAAYIGVYTATDQAMVFDEISLAAAENLEQAAFCLGNKKTDTRPVIPVKLSALIRLDLKIETLAQLRIEEFRQGMEHSDLTGPLNELKLVADQFRFIYSLSQDILRISKPVSTYNASQ